jgi:GDP-mannose 6-dehydrogenase
VVRSTVLPGTTAGVILAELESATGMQVGKDLRLVVHPEFLREGTAVSDFDNPAKIVIGEHTSGHGDRLMQLYERKNQYMAPKFRLTLSEAEMVKYCDNVFHALKITFANEMGSIARAAGVDARRVAEVFCSDTKLNISPHYLRPGFAFGGSCLPKELRAISRYSTMHALPTPMIRGILDSNAAQINALTERVKAHQPRKVGMVGIAFKPQTDDMRESPFVTVAKALIGEGISVMIYDPAVNVGKLIGSNKRAVEIAMGHLKEMLVDTLDQLDGCDTILINHPTVDSKKIQAWTTAGSHVIDLCGIKGVDRKTPGYEGIAW